MDIGSASHTLIKSCNRNWNLHGNKKYDAKINTVYFDRNIQFVNNLDDPEHDSCFAYVDNAWNCGSDLNPLPFPKKKETTN